MIILKRTDSNDPDFRRLVAALDEDLAIRNGDDHSFFSQFNKIDLIRHVVVAYREAEPVGCGTIKQYDERTMEVKRMFVPPAFRGRGIASLVLKELEQWTAELGYAACILETSERLPEAIGLYTRNNYSVIPNYGQYAGVASSVCFEKQLSIR